MRTSSTVRLTKPVWNELPEEREPRTREIEEQVELRRHSKCLADCALPDGFRLVTLRPRQYWIGNQLVWGFSLAWARLDRKGERGEDEFWHMARYHQTVADEPQVRWALEDFTQDLMNAGVRLGELKEFLPRPNTGHNGAKLTIFSGRPAELRYAV